MLTRMVLGQLLTDQLLVLRVLTWSVLRRVCGQVSLRPFTRFPSTWRVHVMSPLWMWELLNLTNM